MSRRGTTADAAKRTVSVVGRMTEKGREPPIERWAARGHEQSVVSEAQLAVKRTYIIRHRLSGGVSLVAIIQRAAYTQPAAIQDVRVDHHPADVAMTEGFLHHAKS